MDFQATNDDDFLGPENVVDTGTSTPNSEPLDVSVTSEDDFESEEAPVNNSTTVAEQVEIHLSNNPDTSNNDNNRSSTVEPNIPLSPVDCATLDILEPCHDAGVSLEFYDILFAFICKHSTKKK